MQDCHCLKQHLIKHRFFFGFFRMEMVHYTEWHMQLQQWLGICFSLFPTGAVLSVTTDCWLGIAHESVCTVLESQTPWHVLLDA